MWGTRPCFSPPTPVARISFLFPIPVACPALISPLSSCKNVLFASPSPHLFCMPAALQACSLSSPS